jgi:hypothetical protein
MPGWYRDRPEPEVRLRGTLRRRESGPTPGGRDRLLVEFVGPEGVSLPAYGPPAEDALLRAVGREVEVSGKVVDRGAGTTLELWVADPAAVHELGG